MARKVVISVMLAAVAALAWQGLTSVPAGADEEAGSLITWGKDSVWGLFPDAVNGQTHAGYYKPGDGSWHMVGDAPDYALQHTGLTFQWQEDGVLFAIGNEDGDPYLYWYSLYDNSWHSEGLPFSLGSGACVTYQPNVSYDGQTCPVPGWLYCVSGGGTDFWRYSIPTSLPETPSGGIYPPDGAQIADRTPLFQWGSAITTRYRLQVARDPSFDTTVIDTLKSLPEHEEFVENGLSLSNGSYYWRSAALMGGLWSWSSVHSFEVNSGWQQLAGVPQSVGTGAATAYDADILGHAAILALVGGNATGFYGYDISCNKWDTLESAPLPENPGTSLTTHDATEASGFYPWAAFGGSDTSDDPYYFDPAHSPHWVDFSQVSRDSCYRSRFPSRLGPGASLVYGTNRNIYLIAGSDYSGNPRSSFYRLQPPGSVMDGSQTSTTCRAVGLAHIISRYDDVQVEYQLPASAHVRATLHDAVGRLIGVLDAGRQQAGVHRLSWNSDGKGPQLSPGAYFLLLDMGKEQARLKVVLR
ncbi:MAG TPA: FlgD immunoglobulin-like domain containing protein [bacterium]|nr:FlgD immunoglobulin-like domain containing protein [bacterium]